MMGLAIGATAVSGLALGFLGGVVFYAYAAGNSL